jgi:uncharacterized protein YbaP (TraB family)
MFRSLSLAFIALSFIIPSFAADAGAPNKSFLWEVKSGSNTIYIFGAPGLGNPDLYPAPFWAEAAYTRAQVLAVESDLTDEKRFAQDSAGMFYPKDDSLENHISKGLYEEVYDFHAAQGLPMESSNHLKPYALALGLLNKEAKTVGLDPGYDASFYFIAKAQADNKPVIEVEGVNQELATLEALPMDLQEELLKSAVENAAQGKWAVELQNEVAAYKSGDLDYYTELDLKSYNKMPHGTDVRNKLVESRHPVLAKKMGKYLETGKVTFVVLSLGHMVGPNNLVEELKKQGFRVERL